MKPTVPFIFVVMTQIVRGTSSQAPADTPETGSQPELSLAYLTSRLSPPTKPSFRLPPTLFVPPKSTPEWKPTPPDWMLGTWYFFASNQDTYTKFFRDMQWTLSRIAGPENSQSTTQLHDLVTYFLQSDNNTSSSHLHFSYGIDTPFAPGIVRDIYHSQPNPPLGFANNTWSVIAWGYDAATVPYVVLHETPAGGQGVASLDFVSRARSGIAASTFEMLKEGIKGLGRLEINVLLANLSVLLQDEARDGMPFPQCNATCMTNAYSVTVIPQASLDRV